jgi:type VI secretion system protein ImpC
MDADLSNLHQLNFSAGANELLAEFHLRVNRCQTRLNCDAETAINRFIEEIDRLLSIQLNEILHDPGFQQLEAAWRGLYYLVSNVETGVSLKVRLFHVSKKELLKDSERALEFYQSTFFSKISDERYYTFGLLVGVYEFGGNLQDMALLERISQTASALQVPFISGVSPTLFQMTDFREFYEVRDFSKIFDQLSYSYYQKWRSLRQSNESNFLGLCVPRILLREPYGRDSIPTDTFLFTEDVGQSGNYLWGNSAFALAQRIANAQQLHGWCVEFTGKEHGKIENLPRTEVSADLDETVKRSSSTEIVVTAEMTRQLAELGFICLTNLPETDDAAFLSVRSVHQASIRETPQMTGIEQQWTHFHYILPVSRFAHHLKQIIIDNWLKFETNDEWRRYLNNWISQFVGNPCSIEKPLAETMVYVEGLPNYPDKPCKIIAFIKPGYQLPEMILPIRVEFRHFHEWLLRYEPPR